MKSNMKRTTGGGHLEIFKMAAASSAFHVWNYGWLLGELNLWYSYELILH